MCIFLLKSQEQKNVTVVKKMCSLLNIKQLPKNNILGKGRKGKQIVKEECSRKQHEHYYGKCKTNKQ